jgi:hypothetical protein
MEDFLVVFVILSLFVWSSCFLERKVEEGTHAVATTSTCCGKGKERGGVQGGCCGPSTTTIHNTLTHTPYLYSLGLFFIHAFFHGWVMG